MKEYIKNTGSVAAIVIMFLLVMEIVHITTTYLAFRANIGQATAGGIMLAVSLAGGAVKTVRERRQKRRAAEIIPILLAEAIQAQEIKLAHIDNEPPSAGKARRRAACKITLVALEEKRNRMIRGKPGGEKAE